MKILITGANGFIGKSIYEFLKKNKYELLAPSKKELDLLNREQVKDCLTNQGIDIVIHAAIYNTLGKKVLNDFEIFKKNVLMFINIADFLNIDQKMIYFGSGAEYAREHYKLNMEEEYFGSYIPTDPYGFSKYIMTRYSENRSNIINLRLFGVFGEYEKVNYRFISNSIIKVQRGDDFEVNCNMLFDYLYIEDLCKICEWFLLNDSKYNVYNVCNTKNIYIADIADIICKVNGNNATYIIKQEEISKSYTGDNSRLLKEIGDFQFTELEDAIIKMSKYFLGSVFETER